MIFDEADIEKIGWENISAVADDDIMLTYSEDTLDSFVEWICINKDYCASYLFFDDKKTFDEVMCKIKNYKD